MKKSILRLLMMATFYSIITFVFQCLFLTVVVASNLSAQSTKSVKEVEVSVEYNNAKLAQVFIDLESKTNYSFVFDKRDKFLNEKFSFPNRLATVEELLIEISRQYQLKFKQVNNNITVNENTRGDDVQVEVLQTRTITGKVREGDTGEDLPGVNIIIKGTSQGTVTDLNGTYSIDVPGPETILIFSSVGFVQEEVAIGNQSVINISLAPDITALEEIVVVGYGTQKKALNTGANLSVDGDDIQKLSTTNALQALQGQTPGMQISSTSGQPGEGFKVVIRGVGSTQGTSPLYVVDGVLTSDITYLNNADIESITVLKDAASAAIYGSQAANGVVLVTTKKGKADMPAQITFDAFYGVQNVARKADMLNSREYATIMNEAAVNSGKLPYFTNEEIAEMGEGTNWLNEMFHDNAVTQNYSFGASGGSQTSTYSTSLSYLSQEGIVGGKDLSNYERYNFRFNSEHKMYNDIVRLGQNLTFAYIESNGIGVGNQYNNTLRAAFNTSPFVPVYDENGNFWDNSNSDWNNTEGNPYASMVYNNQNESSTQKLLGNIYLEVEPIKELKFRTSLGIDYFSDDSHSFSPIYKLSIYDFRNVSGVNQNQSKGRTLLWDNLLSYGFDLGNDHRFDLMVGSSVFQYTGSGMWGSNTNVMFNELSYAWLSNATNTDGVNINLGGGAHDQDNRLSYFGRLNYNFRETYLLNATFRADGSSRFANPWGYFPSVSAGWIVSNESFMGGTSGWLNFFKIRASWGQVGNQNAGAFQYLAPIQFTTTNYIFGPEEGVLTPGAYPIRLSNPDLKWETSEQTNIGFDARLLDGKLNVNFDWYNKINKDWIIVAPVPATAGAEPPFINGGNVTNTGVELALSYSSNIGDFNYTVSANGAYNKNEIGEIPNADGIIHGETNQLYANSQEFYRAQSGFPVGYFWGLTTDGLFQTEAEVAAHRSTEGNIIQPNARPGDVRYVDQNGDGVINDLDRTMIGNPNPDYTFGFSVNANYKGFDLTVLASGVAGNEIVQSYRNHSNPFGNYSTAILDRWHGPGSSNTVPRVTEDNRNWTNFSDLYIHDGSFLRLNNITLGYDIAKLVNRKNLSQVRLYVSALNLYTFTKYEGMDPEIGFGISEDGVEFSSGIDLGYYPRPRTYMVGLNIKF